MGKGSKSSFAKLTDRKYTGEAKKKIKSKSGKINCLPTDDIVVQGCTKLKLSPEEENKLFQFVKLLIGGSDNESDLNFGNGNVEDSQLKRRLIRNDRFTSKADEDVIALEKKLNKIAIRTAVTGTSFNSVTAVPKSKIELKRLDQKTPAGSSKIRVRISCENKGEIKLVVLERSLSRDDIIAFIKKKYSIAKTSKKYNSLRVVKNVILPSPSTTKSNKKKSVMAPVIVEYENFINLFAVDDDALLQLYLEESLVSDRSIISTNEIEENNASEEVNEKEGLSDDDSNVEVEEDDNDDDSNVEVEEDDNDDDSNVEVEEDDNDDDSASAEINQFGVLEVDEDIDDDGDNIVNDEVLDESECENSDGELFSLNNENVSEAFSLLCDDSDSDVENLSSVESAVPCTDQKPEIIELSDEQKLENSVNYRMAFEALCSSNIYMSRLSTRKELPIYASRDAIIQTIRNNQITVISGETGSGKTTQVGSYIFEDMVSRNLYADCNIVCTQPRRIAAITIADRVAYEFCEEPGESIGYQVRLQQVSGPNTKILFCTTGILLRKLLDGNYLSKVSHIIVDEVHERQVETDFLLALLRKECISRPSLRVILMSATLHEKMYSEYFTNSPILYVSGRTYPVTDHFIAECHRVSCVSPGQSVQSPNGSGNHKMKLRGTKGVAFRADFECCPPVFDSGMIANLICGIMKNYGKETKTNQGNCILVFLSGVEAIELVRKSLNSVIKSSESIKILVLHGSQSAADQKRAFKITQPGEWKIVLSTNIAETSVTVPDVTHVIDSGFLKEMRYEPSSGISSLREVFTSRASSRQRAGRAGRVQAGHCWKLFSKKYFDGECAERADEAGTVMAEYPVPEIKRTPLEEIILHILLLQLGDPVVFLRSCIEPPSDAQIATALHNLIEFGAIKAQGMAFLLTPLGTHLAKLPVDIHVGKMLIMGCLFKCLPPILIVAASLCTKSPFFVPIGNNEKKEEARKAHSRFAKPAQYSDHLGIVYAFEEWDRIDRAMQGFQDDKFASGTTRSSHEMGRMFCDKYFLDYRVLKEMRQLKGYFKNCLRSLGMIDDGYQASEINIDDDIPDEVSYDSEYLFFSENLSFSPSLVRCILCAGLSPKIARVCRTYNSSKRKGPGRADMRPIVLDKVGQKLQIHPGSLVCGQLGRLLENVGDNREAFIAYSEKVATSQVYLRDCNSVQELAVILFCGPLLINKTRTCIVACGWLKFKTVSELQAVLYKLLQQEISGILKSKLESPETSVIDRQNRVIQIVNDLL